MNHFNSSTQPEAPKKDVRSRKSVMLSPAQHQQAQKLARQHKVSIVDFVVAALNYFERTGLNPLQPVNTILPNVTATMGQDFAQVREHTTGLGDMLLKAIRHAEVGTGKHLQEQQGGTLLYLERIERTVLTYLTQVEARILLPMLEQLMRTHVLCYSNQVTLTKLFNESQDVLNSVEELRHSLSLLDEQNESNYREYAQAVLTEAKNIPLLTSEKPLVATPPPPISMRAAKPSAPAEPSKSGAEDET